MPTPGRSADDLPLAAYSTGVDPATEPPEMVATVDAIAEVQPEQATAKGGGAAVAAELPIPDDEPKPAVAGAALVRARAFAARNPRVAAGTGFGAVIILGMALLLGGGRGAALAAATAGPSGPVAEPVVVEPGSATLVLTGSVKQTLTLIGSRGQPMTGNLVGALWMDPLQNVLTLDGPVDRGTRTTGAGLVLAWGVMVDDKLVTFTSKAGECTIGMASNPKGVTGSFACRKLRSDDGKLTVGASGTYRT